MIETGECYVILISASPGGAQTCLRLAGLVPPSVVIPTWDRTLPTVIGCLDRAM